MRAVVVALGVTAVALSGCWWTGKVKLPHKALSYAEACPGFENVRCHPDDDPRGLIYNLVPPTLSQAAGSAMYENLIGRAYSQPYRRGDIGRPCGGTEISPITAEHFDTSAAQSSFDYSYKLSSRLNAGAEGDLVRAATAAGLPQAAADRLQASARAAFERVKNREVTTKGRMHIVRLTTPVMDEIRFGSGTTLSGCRTWLVENKDYAIVKAATVFHIERSSSDTQIADQIVADIKANVQGLTDEQIASVSGDIERTVKEQIKTALSDRYIVWANTWLRPEDR